MATAPRLDRCFNPFNRANHSKNKNLRKANDFIQKELNIYGDYVLCIDCKMKVYSNAKRLKAVGDNLNDIDDDQNVNSDIACDNINAEDNSDNIDEQDNNSDQPCNLSLEYASQATQVLQSFESLSFNPDSFPSQPTQSSSVSEVSIETQLPVVNHAFSLLSESPISKKQLRDPLYLERKINRITCNLKKLFRLDDDGPSDLDINLSDFQNLIDRLKAKLNDPNTSTTEKIQILTILPSNWSERKICNMMNSSRHLVQVAKKLSENVGILATPEARLGRKISENLRLKVLNFYSDDNVSINMPGKKDFVSMKNEDGIRTQVQKRLILSNLKELFQSFRNENPDEKIGFSKFASLRPKNCVLAGASGTHTICVCVMHQNIKLMLLGANLSTLTKDSVNPLNHYDDYLRLITCESPTPDCHFNKCANCPGTEVLSEKLVNIFDQNDIETISYKVWISTPRCSLETQLSSSDEFVEKFCADLKVLLPHAYIAKQQAKYLKSLKSNLEEGEYLVVCDFAENYAFVIQNAASGFHWNNNMATIFPVVIYFKNNDEVSHRSLSIISDCNSHDAVAVHVFLKKVTSFVKTISGSAKKLYYFSDGAPQQFKNFKNFVNLYYHEDDFGIPAEWHFFATAHGKGPCDGIGGTVKRMAARASLQLPVDRQITTTPLELFTWTTQPNSLPNISVEFSPLTDYTNASENLADRFARTKSIVGTQKVHCVIPDKNGCLLVKDYSSSHETKLCKLFKRVKK